MKLFIKLLLLFPLFCLGGCYTQMAYKDSYDDLNQNNYNDSSRQINSSTNSEFLTPVCNVVEEPVVDLSGVGVTYNPYAQSNVQTKTRTDQNGNVKSSNGSNQGSNTDTRTRVNPSQGRSSINNSGSTSQPTRARDTSQSAPQNRERSKN
jgi:hypothetical protein